MKNHKLERKKSESIDYAEQLRILGKKNQVHINKEKRNKTNVSNLADLKDEVKIGNENGGPVEVPESNDEVMVGEKAKKVFEMMQGANQDSKQKNLGMDPEREEEGWQMFPEKETKLDETRQRPQMERLEGMKNHKLERKKTESINYAEQLRSLGRKNQVHINKEKHNKTNVSNLADPKDEVKIGNENGRKAEVPESGDEVMVGKKAKRFFEMMQSANQHPEMGWQMKGKNWHKELEREEEGWQGHPEEERNRMMFSEKETQMDEAQQRPEMERLEGMKNHKPERKETESIDYAEQLRSLGRKNQVHFNKEKRNKTNVSNLADPKDEVKIGNENGGPVEVPERNDEVMVGKKAKRVFDMMQGANQDLKQKNWGMDPEMEEEGWQIFPEKETKLDETQLRPEMEMLEGMKNHELERKKSESINYAEQLRSLGKKNQVHLNNEKRNKSKVSNLADTKDEVNIGNENGRKAEVPESGDEVMVGKETKRVYDMMQDGLGKQEEVRKGQQELPEMNHGGINMNLNIQKQRMISHQDVNIKDEKGLDGGWYFPDSDDNKQKKNETKKEATKVEFIC